MERIHYTSLFTEEALQDALNRGMVTKRKHPKHDIYIYNYSSSCQFAWEWTAVTLNCRGLVLDTEGYIVARSLPKFFSYEQLNGVLPEGKFVVEEKMDGSMLLVFNYKGEIVTATRGSFESDQAIDAKRFVRPDMDLFIGEGVTLIFEYIAKQNKIVVNYDYEDLILLAVVFNSSGEDSSQNVDIMAESICYKRPKVYSFESLEEILSYEEPNLEGFVLRYESGERCKIKLAEYKRLHRLITGFNEKDVWEAMKDGKLASVLEEIPDEMYDWVKSVEKDLEYKYSTIEYCAKRDFKDLGSRKDNALYYQTCPHSAILFYMLDGKDYSGIIWKMIKPKVTQTFKVVAEDSN